MQSRGKHKAEVLSQPYWCWSLICMCYQPISLGTHMHTHTHTHMYRGAHARTILTLSHWIENHAHTHTHIQTNRPHFLTEYRCLLTFSLSLSLSLHIFSFTFTRTSFPLSSLPYAPHGLQICRYYRKSLLIRLSGEKRGENY